MLDYRRIPDADRDAFRRGRYYGFAPEEGPTAHESDDEIADTYRGRYDDETLVSACSSYRFPARPEPLPGRGVPLVARGGLPIAGGVSRTGIGRGRVPDRAAFLADAFPERPMWLSERF